MNRHYLPPKISIIIPVYNVESYIAKCLDSCISQTLYDIEIICVDDGSTDRSPDILDYYAQLDHRVRVFHKKNGGVSAARNEGIRHSEGAWIMFVDSDDYLHREACEIIWKESVSEPSDIIIHGGFLIPDYPKPESWKYWTVVTEQLRYPKFRFKVFSERGSNPFLWLQAFSRNLLNRTGVLFPEGINFGEDLIFQFEILPFANGITFIKDRLYYYRWYREGSLMKDATADLDLRTSRHISNIGIISEYWKKHGLLERYGKEYLGWALGFVVPDLEKLKLKNPALLAGQLYDIIDQYELSRYRNRLNHIRSRQYRTMLKLKSGIGNQDSEIGHGEIQKPENGGTNHE